jgi:hypothetical protein
VIGFRFILRLFIGRDETRCCPVFEVMLYYTFSCLLSVYLLGYLLEAESSALDRVVMV